MRVLWTASKSNLSILKEINPEYSLEGLWLKLQYFRHQMQRAYSLEKTLLLGTTDDKRRKGWQRMRRLESMTNSVDMNVSRLREIVEEPGMLHPWGHKE